MSSWRVGHLARLLSLSDRRAMVPRVRCSREDVWNTEGSRPREEGQSRSTWGGRLGGRWNRGSHETSIFFNL